MPHPEPYLVMLTDEITRQLSLLTDQLTQLPPPQGAQVLARVMDPDDGLLGGVSHLLAAGSRFAKNHAALGILPADVWHALGRASNDLSDVALELDEHHDVLRLVAAPPSASAAKPPISAPTVDRRRR